MKNFVQPGHTLTSIAPAGGILSGAGLLDGSLFGVAGYDAAAGAEVEIDVVGVFDLANTAAQAFARGDKVYWNNSTKLATSTSSGNSLIGAATAVAGGSDATVRVRLNGVTV